MKWLLFTNIETDIKDNIVRMRCSFIDFNFEKIVFTKDFLLDDKRHGDIMNMTLEMVENEMITYINSYVKVKDIIYLICNLRTNTIDDVKLINKKMPRLSKYIKESIDLSSLWIILDMYELYGKNVDKIDYCMYEVYGSDNISSNELNSDIML